MYDNHYYSVVYTHCRKSSIVKVTASEMNPKSLKYLIGHSEVVMEVYTHLGDKEAKVEVGKESTK